MEADITNWNSVPPGNNGISQPDVNGYAGPLLKVEIFFHHLLDSQQESNLDI
jgi:hypothetical protein